MVGLNSPVHNRKIGVARSYHFAADQMFKLVLPAENNNKDRLSSDKDC